MTNNLVLPKLVKIPRNVSTTSIASTVSEDEFDYLFPDITDVDEMGSFSDSMDSPQSTPAPIDYEYKSSEASPQLSPAPPLKKETETDGLEGIIPNHCESDGNILICLDWDDTLHPTSALRSKLGIESVRRFCLAVYETLLTLIRLYGAPNIYIVSNADKLWIQQCLNQLSGGYFVNIYHLISLYNIQIISAKNEFSKIHPNNSMKWKQLAFEHLVKKHYMSSSKNSKEFVVVSIGDSQHEYIASKRVIQRLNNEKKIYEKNIVLHRIKLLENPTLSQLISQYQLINKLAFLLKKTDHEINIDYLREMRYYRINNQ